MIGAIFPVRYQIVILGQSTIVVWFKSGLKPLEKFRSFRWQDASLSEYGNGTRTAGSGNRRLKFLELLKATTER